MYGKGKLAEIQNLILGMLDTFNYEQVKVCVRVFKRLYIHRKETNTSRSGI